MDADPDSQVQSHSKISNISDKVLKQSSLLQQKLPKTIKHNWTSLLTQKKATAKLESDSLKLASKLENLQSPALAMKSLPMKKIAAKAVQPPSESLNRLLALSIVWS